MIFSASSILITCVVGALLILFLRILLYFPSNSFVFREDFFSIVAFTIFIRLLLPVEFPFTKSYYIPKIMNPYREFLQAKLIVNSDLKIEHLLLFIYFVGFTVSLTIYILKTLQISSFEERILSKPDKIRTLKDNLTKNTIHIVYSSFISSPVVFGNKNNMYLPNLEFSTKQEEAIVNHELQHLAHKHLLVKTICNMLTILYWFYPPVYVFQQEIDLLLDLKADDFVTKNLSLQQRESYLHSLLEIQKLLLSTIQKSTIPNYLSSHLISEKAKALAFRIENIKNGAHRKSTNKLILLFVLLLPFLSNSIILEPLYSNSIKTKDTIEQDYILKHGKIIKHHDSTYTLILDGKKASIQDPSPFIKAGISVIEEN